MVKIIKIMVKNGRQYSVEVSGKKQFKQLRDQAVSGKSGYFVLCESCLIRRSEIVSVEYVEVEGDK